MVVILNRRSLCSASVCVADVAGNAKEMPRAPRVALVALATGRLEQESRFTAEGVSLEVGQGRWKTNPSQEEA